ncbi:PAS domain-containing protein [Methylobacterium sp. R2-1]|uniref:PAS domain-containing protein n=1 Tax=Methylobacterium sp. R2-1 TaxID=2587064 RepID=UPI001615731F|nr:PAS domain-containing protein [Methylobacterium sp. R2-1]MBB2964516.1 hypothetical protein [Methylobacterium sp. R2-1]
MTTEVRSTVLNSPVPHPERVTLARDWGSTPLGHPHAWSAALKTLCEVIDGSAQPMFIVWGSQRVLIHNQAYAPILAQKHPGALGRPFLEVWSEIRDELSPLVERAYAGEAVRMDDITLMMCRRGVVEEAHFAFSYTPIRGEHGRVEGFFCACWETTEQVLAERERRAVEERLIKPRYEIHVRTDQYEAHWRTTAFEELRYGHQRQPWIGARGADPGTRARAWCAAFVNAVLERSGRRGSRSLAAGSFEGWGVGLKEPALGCIATKKRGNSSWRRHIGFVVGANASTVYLLCKIEVSLRHGFAPSES